MRQGIGIYNCINPGQNTAPSMGVLLFLVAFFVFVVDSYAVCNTLNVEVGCSGGNSSCTRGCPSRLLESYNVSGSASGVGTGCNNGGTVTFRCDGDAEGAFVTSSQFIQSCVGMDFSARANFEVTYCSDPCEAQQLFCQQQGLDYDPDSCKCKMPCPASVCDAQKSLCEGTLEGSFTGSCIRAGEGGEPCCMGYCDICNGPAMKKNQEEMTAACCALTKAPPKIGDVCIQPLVPSARCGMTQSRFITNGENYTCHDPNGSEEMMNRYVEECYGGSSSSTGSSGSAGGSSGGGGSSGDGGGGSSGNGTNYPEGCSECPWLDSVLDTLTAQKHVVEGIATCVKFPSLCSPDASNETIVEIDSSILNGVKDLMDSSLELSNEQIAELLKLDTNVLKLLKLDSASLKFDTLMRLAILSVGTDVQGSISDLQTSVVHLNDSTRKWLRRLADSLSAQNDSNQKYLQAVADSVGITAESLKVHLDSIRNAIPKDILDSILKYQKEGIRDSIAVSNLFIFDSIIDTTVHYWKELMYNDSVRHDENNDSVRSIHQAIDALGFNVGNALGYDDTATTTLHQDVMNLIVIADSNKKYLQAVADSVGVSAESLKVYLDSIKKKIPVDVLDSILKYQKENNRDSVYISNMFSFDSIIDTTVHYLKEMMHNDSVRHEQNQDSLKAVHKAIEAVGLDVGQVLGYGGSQNLHNDLVVLRDSVVKSLKALRDKDSSYRETMADTARAIHDAINDISRRMGDILGYGDTATSDLRRDIDAMRGDVNTFRDSVLKYFGAFVSADSEYRVTFKDSVGSVHGAVDGVKGAVDGVKGSVDGIYSELQKGSYDTSSVYDGYLSGIDTSAVGFANQLGTMLGGALASSAYEGIFAPGSATSSGNYTMMNLDSAATVMQRQNDSAKSALADTMEQWFDELRHDFVLVNFDSAIIAPLGAKVPNTNTCPENCFVIRLSEIGGIFASMPDMNWGLCKPVIGPLNVFEFIRLILRIVTAMTCVYIGLWFISGKK
ncbi:hypothetical protein [Fibrobacter sp.]|uniref:hypothetical protein n=1 Tax=Fibrobacter sp. TaxID=35828 RepID=UPI0025BA5C04|nr:hypothetical protein [Fibrobacter sp.]MBR3073599.1 hypothetical protein [Fibrobacter sp.]